MPKLRNCILGFGYFALSFAAAPYGVLADDLIIKSFRVGNSADSVGIADATEDVELAGPQALTADSEGNLFLLDQLNQRIVRFNPKRPSEDPSIFGLPASLQPSD